jgi:hypothetical protein
MKARRYLLDLLGLLSLAMLAGCTWLWVSSYCVCDIWMVQGERAAGRGDGSRWVYGVTTDPGRLTLFRVLNLSDDDALGRTTHYTEPPAVRPIGGAFDVSLAGSGIVWTVPFWPLVLLTAALPGWRGWRLTIRPARPTGFEVRLKAGRVTGRDEGESARCGIPRH